MKLSAPMEEALMNVANTRLGSTEAMPGKANTVDGLVKRHLLFVTMNGDVPMWTLTDDGREEAARIRAERDAAFDASPEGRHEAAQVEAATLAIAGIADREAAKQTLASLPEISGYRWQWFNPQGGLPESRTVIQLMYADDRTLSPAALLHRNGDGTWHATRGAAWGMSGFIAGKYQASFTILQCAGLVAVEADERGMLATWAKLQDEARSATDADERMLMEEAERIRRDDDMSEEYTLNPANWSPVKPERPVKLPGACDAWNVSRPGRKRKAPYGHRAGWRKAR